MKTALLLLILACLLVTTPGSAAAYEPTNGIALDANYYVTKIIAKEEVVAALALDENAAIPAVSMEREAVSGNVPTTTALIRMDALYDDRTKQARWLWRIDRVHSRFG